MEIEDIKAHIDENHASPAAQNIRSIIFGGVDGVITTFSIMAASAGASLEVKVIILLGIANLLADAFSMGFGDYLSSTSERNYILSELAKESHEYDENKEYEMDELIGLYKEKGMEEEDARKFIGILASKPAYKDLFLMHMMQHELELPEADEVKDIVRKSLFTFLSFVCFGSLPLWVYLIVYFADLENNAIVFTIACVVAAITLFVIGAFGAVLTRQNIWRAGFLTFSNGMFATVIAFFLGWGIENALQTLNLHEAKICLVTTPSNSSSSFMFLSFLTSESALSNFAAKFATVHKSDYEESHPKRRSPFTQEELAISDQPLGSV